MYIPKLTNERERIEFYLAASSLEETVFRIERACQLLKEALNSGDGNMQHGSRAYCIGTIGHLGRIRRGNGGFPALAVQPLPN